MPNGYRNLTVESTLSALETKFTRIRTRIRRREKLTAIDRVELCMFTAAMQGRTIAAGEHFRATQQKLHDVMISNEIQFNVASGNSAFFANMVREAPQYNVMMMLDIQTPLYFSMEMTILVTDDPVGFITSDVPCVWRNPQAHRMPPYYRSPGLAQADIEVSLPLTPQHMLLLSHKKNPLYADVPPEIVVEANRLTRHSCTEEFVSWKGEMDPRWFEKGVMPADAWENTAEGKEAALRQAEWDKVSGSVVIDDRGAE